MDIKGKEIPLDILASTIVKLPSCLHRWFAMDF